MREKEFNNIKMPSKTKITLDIKVLLCLINYFK